MMGGRENWSRIVRCLKWLKMLVLVSVEGFCMGVLVLYIYRVFTNSQILREQCQNHGDWV